VIKAPLMTQARIDTSRLGGEIDGAVRTAAAANEPLFILDEAAIIAANPSVIITQGLCPVCAVDEGHVRKLAAQIRPVPTVITVQPMSLADVLRNIVEIGSALGRETAAGNLIDHLTDRMSAMHPPVNIRPRVLLLEWLDPFFSAGHWNPELITLAGGEPVLAVAGTLSRQVSLDQIEAADPDVIVLAPCGYSRQRAEQEAATLSASARWNDLRAVREGNVHIADGSHFFNRPGPRLIDSIEYLARHIHAQHANLIA
jgi:iron complex transport system substrate-binding protein